MNKGEKVLTKKEMAKKLARKFPVSYRIAIDMLEYLLTDFADTLKEGGSVSLKNVGTLKVKEVPGRDLNLKNFKGTVPPRHKVKFIQSTNLIVGVPEKPTKK